MPSLTIKDIPPSLLDRLRSLAQAERRSLTRQALVLIERGLDAPASRTSRAEAVREQIAAWRTIAGTWTSDRAADDEIGEIYDARTPGREVDL